ncbi:hypothetical protein SAMN05660464_0410 [Geodermatophilus dictyosporus]|uniref:Lipoprotein n=1 Tax=Geodermatophilus dictyosporus TaxID=1523247 RepID=A0A1I5UWS1_9ACTN|nr:hypothetical protein [Geodermatophilus dictyosporus]SFP99705.1 hypothetical protein SAMN05660464_0410 [Geodermatophilus dictyosporus]
MRSVFSRSRPVLLAAVGAFLLTAGSCGGGGEGSQAEESAEVTSAGTSSSAASSTGASSGSAGADPAVAEFCTAAEQFATTIGTAQSSTTPEEVVPVLQQAATDFESATPPQEIATDWGVLGGALRTWADTAGSVDLATPDGQQQFQQRGQEFITAFQGPSGTNVEQYLTANCPGA